MPRPQGVQPDKFVDAAVCASSGSTLQRSFSSADLPRWQQAGAGEGSMLNADFHFLDVEARVAIDGMLDGVARMTCQRCMRSVDVPLRERFNVILVEDEALLADEIAGYEPILADPTRLDLRSLAEDQALLALPLVPRHEAEDCSSEVSAVPKADPAAGARQMPFKDLRALLHKH